MTKVESELMAHCLDFMFCEGPDGTAMDPSAPIGVSTLEWLRKLGELKRAVRQERANPEMVQFLRKGYQARQDGKDAWQRAKEEAAVRWGQESVDEAMPLVWEGIRQ